MTRPADELAERLEHFVNQAPFDASTLEAMTPEQERYFQAPAWKLVWWKFRRHRLALISFYFLLFAYLSANSYNEKRVAFHPRFADASLLLASAGFRCQWNPNVASGTLMPFVSFTLSGHKVNSVQGRMTK